MALDGALLSVIIKELSAVAIGSRVEKIYQPSQEELVIALRLPQYTEPYGNAVKLLLCSGANSPRIHFTKSSIENPKVPPMLCMLLRKRIGAAKLVGIRQLGLDRAVFFDFDATDELGDPSPVTIAVELMGRHTNIIAINKDNTVIDAVRRITGETSSVRQILPGILYELPPSQDKLDPRTLSGSELADRLLSEHPDSQLQKRIISTVEGLSPLLCRELAFIAGGSTDCCVCDIDAAGRFRLAEQLDKIRALLGAETVPCYMTLNEDGRPLDYSFIPIRQYGNLASIREYPTCSALFDDFYRERGASDRMKQRSHELLRHVTNISERIARKLGNQRLELEQSRDRDELRVCGDILNANLYRLEKGMISCELENFYAEGCPTIKIKLDPALTPVQNAQKYYSEYRKACTAEKKLSELIASGEEDAAYIDSVLGLITRARTETELNSIRDELIEQGFVKARGVQRSKNGKNSKDKKPEKLPPLRYRSSDGFEIVSGRNNLQNDQLTLKQSRPWDIWFHTQKIAGSHTIIITNGEQVPNRTLEEAAIIAAYNSNARESTKVPVDYTIVKNVKKPNGAKPGMVIYETYQTAIVTPDGALVESLMV